MIKSAEGAVDRLAHVGTVAGHLPVNKLAKSAPTPICFWEDDAVQLRWPDWAGGANKPHLLDAQRTYATEGACETGLISHVRSATDHEPLDPGWRPIDLTRENFEARGARAAPWPDDQTQLYWWRPSFWRRASNPEVASET